MTHNYNKSTSLSWSVNEWADFWRYSIGANIVPADTRKKTLYVSWKKWQDNPIPEEQHIKWKNGGAFNKGMAVVAGTPWNNLDKKDLYLILVDLDNQKAIDEFCTRNGRQKSLTELALIGCRADDTNTRISN